MKSDIANHSFLKRKLDIVKRGEFEERLEKHMYQKASFYVILWGAGGGVCFTLVK